MNIRKKTEKEKLRGNLSEKRIEFETTMGKFKKTSVHMIEKEVEKRERLLQTYVVVFGLLLAYGQDEPLQKTMMGWFILFLIASMMYYSSLTTSLPTPSFLVKHAIHGNVLMINILALFSSLILSYVVNTLFTQIAFPLGAFQYWITIMLLTYVLYLPLRGDRSMFEE